jgi:hypothetical protein
LTKKEIPAPKALKRREIMTNPKSKFLSPLYESRVQASFPRREQAMRAGKVTCYFLKVISMFSGIVLATILSIACASLWDESQSLRAYDGPARPREELALVICNRALTVISIDGKGASEYSQAAGQKKILADTTLKERFFKYSPNRIDWPYGYMLLPGEHVLVVVGRKFITGTWNLKFVARRGESYLLTYENLGVISTTVSGFTAKVRAIIRRSSTNEIVSTEVR